MRSEEGCKRSSIISFRRQKSPFAFTQKLYLITAQLSKGNAALYLWRMTTLKSLRLISHPAVVSYSAACLGRGRLTLRAIAHGLARRGRSTRYLTVAELIRLIRDTWQRNSFSTTAEVLRRLRELDLLVLDEVGVQFGTEAELTQLTEVMDVRYRDTKPTLVISNCAIGDLKRYLGDRIVDRLMENGGKIVIFNWPSRRV